MAREYSGSIPTTQLVVRSYPTYKEARPGSPVSLARAALATRGPRERERETTLRSCRRLSMNNPPTALVEFDGPFATLVGLSFQSRGKPHLSFYC